MSDDHSPPTAPNQGTPAQRFGAPRAAAVPRMETVRVTAPDLYRRAAMEKTRVRLVFTAIGFVLLFAAVVLKLADATIIQPLPSHQPERPLAQALDKPKSQEAGPLAERAMITDRNGEVLAISLPTAALYANPRELIDAGEAARKLKAALPRLDEEEVQARLGEDTKQFVYLARQLTPSEEMRINALGIPGIYFQQSERRHYPMGRTAAQVLGGVDVDAHGIAGVEREFDTQLRTDSAPLRLSLDVRVQAVVRDELSKAMEEFRAIGACGIVMDVNTGEVLAMVSLPDYDAADVGTASADERFNRAVTGMYEPGSTFKLQTAAMALDSGVANIWSEFDASRDIHIGRFTITDFEGKHRWLYLPEVLAYSSNLGAAHIAETTGSERQRAWLRDMGMFRRVGIELPEAGVPIIPPAANWKEVVTLTVGFGHGIAISPLHVVRGTAAVANGGILVQPTILAESPGAAIGQRVMQRSTSDTMRKLMRLVVTDGYGKSAEVPGFYPGGKTGTAEKVGAHGYKKHANVAAFISVFPMNAPRYAVYMMLDEPHANASTHGYATAGWVVAPSAGQVIARAGPMLGILPDLDDKVAIQQALYIPLRPSRPAGAARAVMAAPPRPAGPVPTGAREIMPARPARDPGREADGAVTPPVPSHAASAVAAR
ncbi:MAG: penicillin-binding protein 2 [Alphaproteobacteria bacterium]|nr:penicillin-binding protein 2 [Alphaproteobacteria bacterium]